MVCQRYNRAAAAMMAPKKAANLLSMATRMAEPVKVADGAIGVTTDDEGCVEMPENDADEAEVGLTVIDHPELTFEDVGRTVVLLHAG